MTKVEEKYLATLLKIFTSAALRWALIGSIVGAIFAILLAYYAQLNEWQSIIGLMGFPVLIGLLLGLIVCRISQRLLGHNNGKASERSKEKGRIWLPGDD